MTEAIGGEEQRAGLLLPDVAGNTREDDLILNAFGEFVADLSNRIKLKDTGLACGSGTLQLLAAPSDRFGGIRFGAEVAAHDAERDLVLSAHRPAGAVYVKIDLGGFGGEAVCRSRRVSHNADCHHGNDHHHRKQNRNHSLYHAITSSVDH